MRAKVSIAKPYRPSGPAEFDAFTDCWCDRCRHESEFRRTDCEASACSIAIAATLHQLGSPQYPPEWISEPGTTAGRCTAFERE
jgi:hypothetical protein